MVELAAVEALGAEAAGRAFRGDVAKVVAIKAFLAAAGLLGGLCVRVRRLRAVAADVADLTAVQARLAAAAAAGSRRSAGVLGAVTLQVANLAADVARHRGVGGLAARVLGAIPLEVAGVPSWTPLFSATATGEITGR